MDQLDFGVTLRSFIPNQKVFNRYILQRILGRGGMGIVWLARDGELDRPVALKFLPEIVSLDPASVAELKRETRRNLDLTHPHIVRIYDFVQDTRSAAISMEYVDGSSLSSLKAERPHGIFTLRELEPWVAQLAEGLGYAHERARVIHRDLKPANLMVTTGGELKITDFGIATSISDSVSRISGRSTSGTAAYMSPQQMMGERASPTDDIYAVGATLYELLTGRPPFHSGNVIAQVTGKVPPSIAARRTEFGVADLEPVPAAWEETIARCLAKEAAARPQSMSALLAGLRGEVPTASKGGTRGFSRVESVPPDVERAGTARSTTDVSTGGTRGFSRVEPPLPAAERAGTARSTAQVSGFRFPRSLFVAAALILLATAGYLLFVRDRGAPPSDQSRIAENTPPSATPDAALKSEASLSNTLATSSATADPSRPLSSSATEPATRPADPPPLTTGSLMVTSDPDDAEVTLGDSTRRTPTQFQNVPAGRVLLSFAKEGFETRRLELELAAGQALTVPTVQLAPLLFAVELTSATPAVDYTIEAGGQLLRGALPAIVRLPAGRYPARFTRAGYGDRYESIVVKEAGASVEVDLRGAALTLGSTPAGAAVTIDGRPAGTTPLKLTDLPPGRKTVSLALAEHLPRTVTLDVALGGSSAETFALTPDPQVVYLRALAGHWAAGLNGLRVTDTSGVATYRAGANFVKGRNFTLNLVRFDPATQTGVFKPDDDKLPTFEIVWRGGTAVLRWQTNGRGRFYDVPMTKCTEEYFNKL